MFLSNIFIHQSMGNAFENWLSASTIDKFIKITKLIKKSNKALLLPLSFIKTMLTY